MKMKSIILLLFLGQATLIMSEPLYADIFRCKKDSGSFLANSQYEKDLKTAMDRLSVSVKNGIHVGRAGVVFALCFCAGYLKTGDCASCVNNTIPLLLKSCPKQNQALAWRSKCMVQYGLENNVGDFDSWFVAHETSDNKTKDVQGLEKTMKVLVDKLSNEAVTKTNYYYAYGTMPYGSRQTLFMVMQCISVLKQEECLNCLQVRVYGEMKRCCSGATAAATITTGCYMRYAHDDFRVR
ncbi:putative Gnk2-like domain-containing protein [Helianthus annuus]|nr:putative Gnk2-like domain-containing protein [Helianthus annuus]